MTRADARPLALRALRSLLEGEPAQTLQVAGRQVTIMTERLPTPAWPRIEGLDPQQDGPWPAPLRVLCRWDGGEVGLLVCCEYWKTKGRYRHCLGLRVRVAEEDQELLWTTVETIIAATADGAEASITGDVSVRARMNEDEDRNRRLSAQLRPLVDAAGLPRTSAWRVELFRLRPPDASLTPAAGDALTRVVLLALLKLPFLARDGRVSRANALPFAIESLPAGELVEETDGPFETDDDDKRLAAMMPLPGGVRQYKQTLDEIVDWLDEPRQPSDLDEWFQTRFQVNGAVALKAYSRFLRSVGLVEVDGGLLRLTSTGEEYRAAKDSRFLFRHFVATVRGVLEALVIVAEWGPIDRTQHEEHLKRLLRVEWKTTNQTVFRRNWLLSLGMTERRDAGDTLTSLGREMLAAYEERVSEIARELRRVVKPEDTVDDADDVEIESIEPALLDRVQLSAENVVPHLGGIELPAGVVEQACAALSCGKHLLLVGPPGTGKTELAVALGRAARNQDYCQGLRPTTANADWTTFETVGGYALEPAQDGHRLVFRPGVFLQALENDEWLLIDELNRADVDRAFGELMTVLAGRGAALPYRLEDERAVSVGPPGDETEPPGGWSHVVKPTFRLIATMNTWDKSSLFKLSYALQRRFAILYVDIPPDDAYARLIQRAAEDGAFDPPLDERVSRQLTTMFRQSGDGLLRHRRVGPAVVLDIVRYARHRATSAAPGDAVAEALAMFLLPQLEGLGSAESRAVRRLVSATLEGWEGARGKELLRDRWRELLLDEGTGDETAA